MSTTVWGTASKVGGVAAHYNRFGAVTRAHSYKSLALDLPDGGITVDADHDHGRYGTLVYAELGDDQALRCVAVVDGDQLADIDEPVYFSGEFELRGDVDKHVCVAREAALFGLSLTFAPATVGALPIKLRGGDIRRSIDRYTWPCSWQQTDPLLARALDHLGDGLGVEQRSATRIVDRRPVKAATLDDVTAKRVGPLEFRSAQPIDVNTARRQITVLAAPYAVEALVPVGGRMVAESFTNTAFAGKQPDRIYSTRDHDTQRLIGRVTDLEPFHREGLHATIKVADTELGRESIELARDQVLAASIGFQIPAGGETWESRSRRRVTRAILREVSLVADPAYPTHIVDVRDALAR